MTPNQDKEIVDKIAGTGFVYSDSNIRRMLLIAVQKGRELERKENKPLFTEKQQIANIQDTIDQAIAQGRLQLAEELIGIIACNYKFNPNDKGKLIQIREADLIKQKLQKEIQQWIYLNLKEKH